MNEPKPTHVYIGRKSCGCCVAAAVDMGDKWTGESVSEFIQEGLAVDRIEFDDYKTRVANEPGFMGCVHKQSTPGQMQLDLSDGAIL